MMMQDYLEKNHSAGISVLWKLFCKLTATAACRQALIAKGILRYVSLSIEFSHSHVLSALILKTLKNLCEDQKAFLVKSGPKVVYNLLSMIDTVSTENLLLIVTLLGYTGLEAAEKGNSDLSKQIIQKILEVGISSGDEVKFAILNVIEKMFSQKNQVLGSKINSERIMVLIISALNHGTVSIKETASKLTLKMILTENIDLSLEPDLMSLVLLNCKLYEPEYFELRKLSIEIIFRMAVSVRYVNLIVLSAQHVLDMAKISLSILHPEILQGGSQNLFLVFDNVRIDDDGMQGDQRDEDSIMYMTKVQGYKERIIQQIEVATELYPEDQKKRGFKKAKTMVQVAEDYEDSDDYEDEEENTVLQDIESNITDVEYNIIQHTKDLVAMYDKLNLEHLVKKVDSKGAEVYISTYYLVKLITILLSCDITYSKVFSLSLHSICGIVLEKAIGARVGARLILGSHGVRLHPDLLQHAFRHHILQTQLRTERSPGFFDQHYFEQVHHQGAESHQKRTRRRSD